MARYNAIGKNYSKTRRPDPRIVNALIKHMNISPPAVIADIGAGTGNYTNAVADSGFELIAIEPSETMQSQAQEHENVTWKTGHAENLPVSDNQVDSVICTLALHHFTDLKKAFKEMVRICNHGAIVLFTCDPRLARDFWLLDYFPSFYEEGCKYFPSIENVTDLLSNITSQQVCVYPFPLPADLKDQFLASIWKTPEKVLDPAYRAAVSPFALGNQEAIQAGLEKLKANLETGAWHDKYHSYLKLQTYDVGYRFVVVRSKVNEFVAEF